MNNNGKAVDLKELGKSGISVSEIAFGGVEIGVPYGLGVKDKADMLAEAEAIALLHKALDEGINFFDTARLYGDSERIMGLAFSDRRTQVVLASKCRHLRQPDGQLVPRSELAAYIRSSLQESLQALQTDYIDLYMVHYADMEILQLDEVAAIFMSLKKEGLVRSIGVSVYKAEETIQAIEAGMWEAIQLPFNLMDQSHGAHFDAAMAQGVGIVVRSVLMRGLLTDRLQKLHPALNDVARHIDRYRSLMGNDHADLPQMATKFALAHEAVSSVLVGIDKEQYLVDALATTEGGSVGGALLAELQGMAYPDPAFLNLAEWDKNGWL